MSEKNVTETTKIPIRLKIPIEVPYAISIFALVFAESITTNWMMYRTCYTTLGFNETDCALLGSGNQSNSTTELEQKVQPYVTVIALVKSLTQVIAAVVCFFLGPWSDKHGRRPVLLLSFASYALHYAIMSVISAIPNLSPWYVLLCSVPIGLIGGSVAQLTMMLCYITDITTTSGRGIRMAIFETTSTAGSLIGTISSSYVLYVTSYTTMFVIATCCYLLCCLIVLLFLEESVKNIEPNGKFGSFFQISLLKKSIHATFKKRDDYKRAALFLIISILLMYAFAYSEYNFTFLYLRKTLNWSLQKFTIYSGGTTTTGILGGLLGVYIIHTILKINESVVVILGLLSAFSSAFVIALATNDWYIYVGGALKFLIGSISPMVRSLASKVALEDSSSVFGFIAVCESLILLIAKFVYTYIYNELFASALYFFTAGLCLVGVITTIALIFIQKYKSSDTNYSIMENEVA